jgi:hypothetical protein
VFEAHRSSTTTTHPAAIYINRTDASSGTIAVAAALAYYACQVGMLKRWLPVEQQASVTDCLKPEAQERCKRAYYQCYDALTASSIQDRDSMPVVLN